MVGIVHGEVIDRIVQVQAKSVKMTAKTPNIEQKWTAASKTIYIEYLMKYHGPSHETFKITVEINIVSIPFLSCQISLTSTIYFIIKNNRLFNIFYTIIIFHGRENQIYQGFCGMLKVNMHVYQLCS